jgi:hypothetical protein
MVHRGGIVHPDLARHAAHFAPVAPTCQ